MQNKALCLITSAFKTTPIPTLEIESSIPPIDITLNYYTDQYATCTQRLDPSNPIMGRIPDQHREDLLTQSTPPLPWFPPPPRNIIAPYLIRQHEAKVKKTTTTRLICMAKSITNNMECISPHAEPPCYTVGWNMTIISRSMSASTSQKIRQTHQQTWSRHRTTPTYMHRTPPRRR